MTSGCDLNWELWQFTWTEKLEDREPLRLVAAFDTLEDAREARREVGSYYGDMRIFDPYRRKFV